MKDFTNILLPRASPPAHIMVERVIEETSDKDEE